MVKKAYGMLRKQGMRAFSHLIKEKLNSQMMNHEKYRHWIAQYESTMIRGEEYGEWLTQVTADARVYANVLAVKTPWVLLHTDQVTISSRMACAVRKYLEYHPQTCFLYTDGDWKVDGVRKKPTFKADWSPDTYFCIDYIGSMMLIKTSLARQVLEEMQEPVQSGWLYDFGLRATEQLNAEQIGHLPLILYHRVKRKVPVDSEYLRRMKENAIERRKKKWLEEGNLPTTKAYVEMRKEGRVGAIVYKPVPDQQGQVPLISIVVPSKDNPQLLETCMKSVETYTTYDAVQWIVVDNGSTSEHRRAYQALFETLRFPCEYIYEPMEFNFSSMCNLGAKYAAGQLVLFLNDDMELPASSGDWLERLAGQAMQPHNGAVGAKLLYPNSTWIQHLGVVNYTTGAAHLLWQRDDKKVQPYWRNLTEHNYAVVTGACICIEKEKFWSVGGFEEKLAVTFNDVALCFALLRAGYYQVVRSDVVLYHHESITRGNDHLDPAKVVRNLRERELLFDLYPEYVGVDPFYSRHLTQKRLDHTMDYVDRPKLRSIHKEKMPEQKLNAKIHYRIERVQKEMEITIEGWAYREGKKAGKCKQILLVGDNGEVFGVPVQKVYTPTLNDLMQTTQNLYLAGFAARFARSELESGVNYELWVECDGAFERTKSTIEI